MKPITFACEETLDFLPVQIAEQILDISRWSSFKGYAVLPGIRTAEFEVRTPEVVGSRVRMHLKISEKQDGLAEFWQDGVPVVSARGQTLPLAGTIYDDLEVGISAHGFGPGTAVLYVDDVTISSEPIAAVRPESEAAPEPRP